MSVPLWENMRIAARQMNSSKKFGKLRLLFDSHSRGFVSSVSMKFLITHFIFIDLYHILLVCTRNLQSSHQVVWWWIVQYRVLAWKYSLFSSSSWPQTRSNWRGNSLLITQRCMTNGVYTIFFVRKYVCIWRWIVFFLFLASVLLNFAKLEKY